MHRVAPSPTSPPRVLPKAEDTPPRGGPLLPLSLSLSTLLHTTGVMDVPESVVHDGGVGGCGDGVDCVLSDDLGITSSGASGDAVVGGGVGRGVERISGRRLQQAFGVNGSAAGCVSSSLPPSEATPPSRTLHHSLSNIPRLDASFPGNLGPSKPFSCWRRMCKKSHLDFRRRRHARKPVFF